MPAEPTAKDRFTSLDTLALTRELRALDRARVDKAFDLPGGGWSLTFRVPGEGRRELALVPGRYAALLATGVDHAEGLSPLAKELRRLLSGAAIQEVSEPAGERYLELRLARSDDPEPTVVALEMFGKGNLIVSRGRRIAAVAEVRRWAHRQVRVGAEYLRPPVRSDPWAVGRAELEQELARSRSDLASTVAARLAFGGPVAEELIARTGLDGAQPASLDAAAIAERLHDAIGRLLRELGERPTGFVYLRAGSALDATPYASQRWGVVSGVEEVRRPTFSEAAYEYFAALTIVPPPPAEAQAIERRRELERLREQQSAAVRSLTGSMEAAQADANAILAHYEEAEAALRAAETAASESSHVEVVLGGRSVSLAQGRSPRESARELFEESKRFRAKLLGAQAALRETEARIQSEAGLTPGEGSSTRPAAVAAHKAFWFERFRWFVSSEGAIIVGGRDAASNDLLVRRNLKDGDLYVHADLHGAASVIVKRPTEGAPPITELSLREAGQWAVVYSKAWRAGLASASAFWVEHDQVSKAAPSGEFVARGAWVIHGTKHVLRDLPLEIGLGTIDYRGTSLWTAAPPSAVRALGSLRVLLVPGEEREREAVETSLSRELGLSRPRLQSLLPAGGLAVRRP